MRTASVVVCSFGDAAYWEPLAQRACDSVDAQSVGFAIELIRVPHSNDTDPCILGRLRNEGAAMATGERVLFQDADDELAPDMMEHLLAAPGDIRVPALSYWNERRAEWNAPIQRKLKPYLSGVAGLIRREAFLALGGFRALPVLEDDDLWMRASAAGLRFVDVPEAVYRVRTRPGSRRSTPGRVRADVQRQLQVEAREAARAARRVA